MPSNLENRLSKLEVERTPTQRSHEDWLTILDSSPPLTEIESATMDAAIEAEAIAEFGSLTAAATAIRTRGNYTRDLAAFLATDLECRAATEADDAHA